ncbi:MAG: glycosyl transferase [Gammaproteobacteria bacterium]|nr:glycosyl transferase [Gammaproteobacteria bacterium]
MAGLSGFIVMSFELLGGRMLAPWFGSGTYVWGSVITIFMAALAIGYLLGGRLSLHSPSLSRYAALFILAALLLAPLVTYADRLLEWTFNLIEDERYGSLLAATFLFAPGTVLLGMISPYSVRLLVEDTHRSGAVAGVLYFVSTLGSALGTLLTSFYFVLWFEMNTIVIALAATLAVLALLGVIADRVT